MASAIFATSSAVFIAGVPNDLICSVHGMARCDVIIASLSDLRADSRDLATALAPITSGRALK